MGLQQTIFTRLYRKAKRVETLPWHREDPPPLLERAVASRPTRGRALDLGCGEGVYATWLAQQGFAVTAIDFVPAAIEATRERAAAAGVTLDLHVGDVVEHAPAEPYEVVLDSGCLHHLPKAKIPEYRKRMDGWLAPGGSLVLVHFAHKGKVPIPMGPNALTREQAVAMFAPFQLEATEETHFEVPLPMGRMTAGVYWFTRPA